MKPIIYERKYNCGTASFELGPRTLIMGILNATPDSFSDGGLYNDTEKAVAHALSMIEAGAEIIDVGGESTRPGHDPVSQEEELNRVLPVIQAVHKAAPHIPISVDTYKAEVARQSLLAGAHIINDIWGFKKDPKMAAVAAEFGCPAILMHNRDNMDYGDLAEDMIADLKESIEIALRAGVKPEQIILDPGIGFAKTYQHNLEAMRSLHKLAEMGYPLLLATSRKRFIRTVLDVPVDETVFGTAATVAFGIAQGCQIVRVHDVKEIKQTALMCDAMLYG
ncbi:dihydropteroate synthase [Paenibacillus pinistramenti]|uniref:dihydropteroate synthase n=1 Tax=Paenibacillus pinistramenti TaxID=1768003 RepID=UPI0011082598|nr:dihydropteroate synthase [Paenibacillus pinistramenti]